MSILDEIAQERSQQDKKWGVQNHNNFFWSAILGEEFGEACQAALHEVEEPEKDTNLREELIQTAAVAVAWIECLDRGGNDST